MAQDQGRPLLNRCLPLAAARLISDKSIAWLCRLGLASTIQTITWNNQPLESTHYMFSGLLAGVTSADMSAGNAGEALAREWCLCSSLNVSLADIDKNTILPLCTT
eukprot:282712-Amphidinium_carterae.1